LLPIFGEELQSEYFLPRQHAVAAIMAVERLNAQITRILLESEIRTIAADELWMSPCYGRDSVALHFCWKADWPAVERVLPILEKALAPFDPRPHWGKLFAMSPAELQSKYEKLDDFLKLAERHDPKGKFRNHFLETNIFTNPKIEFASKL
jgi:xylitol oxidase